MCWVLLSHARGWGRVEESLAQTKYEEIFSFSFLLPLCFHNRRTFFPSDDVSIQEFLFGFLFVSKMAAEDDDVDEQVEEVAKGQKGEQARAMQNLDGLGGAEIEIDSASAQKVK
jgi:hypothetical protein